MQIGPADHLLAIRGSHGHVARECSVLADSNDICRPGAQAFFARKLDLEQPSHPLLISGAHRLKVPGADIAALVQQDRQLHRLEREPSPRPDIDTMLADLRSREKDAIGVAKGRDPAKS